MRLGDGAAFDARRGRESAGRENGLRHDRRTVQQDRAGIGKGQLRRYDPAGDRRFDETGAVHRYGGDFFADHAGVSGGDPARDKSNHRCGIRRGTPDAVQLSQSDHDREP